MKRLVGGFEILPHKPLLNVQEGFGEVKTAVFQSPLVVSIVAFLVIGMGGFYMTTSATATTRQLLMMPVVGFIPIRTESISQ